MSKLVPEFSFSHKKLPRRQGSGEHMLSKCRCVSLIAVAVALSGCQQGGDFEYAPVSGTVTLDGKPLPDARVYFVPKRQGDSIRAGKTSVGRTDAEGAFTLNAADNQVGAVIGSHKVKIRTYAETSDPGSDDVVVAAPELVPAKYNFNSILTCDVPAEGLPDCRFDLTTK